MRNPADPQGRGDRQGQDLERPTAGRRMAAAYQGALEAVLALVITTGVGYWFDRRWGTSHYLLIGIVVGFWAFTVRLWRLRELMVEPPDKPEGTSQPPTE